MNRETLPMIFALFVPVILVLIILLYHYGYDITQFFRQIDVIYYLIILPIGLGFIVAITKLVRPA